MKHAHLIFPAGEVVIQLLDTPVVDLWIDINEQYSKFNCDFLVNRGTMMHVGHEMLKDRTIDVEQKAVYEINNAIEDLNKIITTEPFPYKAFVDMPWQQTNLIHRAFTTGISSYHTFTHNLAYQDLLNFQVYKYDDKDKIKSLSDKVFNVPRDEGLQEYVRVMNVINKYVHHFEDIRYSNNANLVLKELREVTDTPDEIQINWDSYDRVSGVKSIWLRHIPTYDEILKSARVDLDEYDVYAVKSILGKDYETAFSNYDNPLEYDIQNIQDITGGLRIILNGAQKKLYKDSHFTRFCDSYGLDKRLYLPIPIGKIVSSDFKLNDIYTNRNLPYNSDGSAGPDLKFRKPKIHIK
jgi:hypothetical protein